MLDDVVKLAYKGCLELADNPTGRNDTGYKCEWCAEKLTVAYHEDRLYSVHCAKCRRITLIEAASYDEAVNRCGRGMKMAESTLRKIKAYGKDPQDALLALMDYYDKNKLENISEEQAVNFLRKLESGEIKIGGEFNG